MLSKPTIKKINRNEGILTYAGYYLPNHRMLYVSHVKRGKDYNSKYITRIKLFSYFDLNTPIKEMYLNSIYNVETVTPSGNILLTCRCLDKLCVVNSETFDILSHPQKWNSFRYIAAMNDDRIICIKNINDRENKSDNYRLSIYGLSNFTYSCTNKISLFTKPGWHQTLISRLLELENNKFCFGLEDKFASDGYEVHIVEIDDETLRIKQRSFIPSSQFKGCDNTNLSFHKLKVLPNKNLLTYHYRREIVEIWDTTTTMCVKSWDWLKIMRNFPYHFIEIEPFPDSQHLLIQANKEFYIFNIENLTIKLIDFNFSSVIKYSVLPSGKLITLIGKDKTIKKAACLDFPEIYKVRKRITDYRLSEATALRFLSSKFPSEISKTIFSYAFNENVKKSYLENETLEDKKSKCLLM